MVSHFSCVLWPTRFVYVSVRHLCFWLKKMFLCLPNILPNTTMQFNAKVYELFCKYINRKWYFIVKRNEIIESHRKYCKIRQKCIHDIYLLKCCLPIFRLLFTYNIGFVRDFTRFVSFRIIFEFCWSDLLMHRYSASDGFYI